MIIRLFRRNDFGFSPEVSILGPQEDHVSTLVLGFCHGLTDPLIKQQQQETFLLCFRCRKVEHILLAHVVFTTVVTTQKSASYEAAPSRPGAGCQLFTSKRRSKRGIWTPGSPWPSLTPSLCLSLFILLPDSTLAVLRLLLNSPVTWSVFNSASSQAPLPEILIQYVREEAQEPACCQKAGGLDLGDSFNMCWRNTAPTQEPQGRPCSSLNIPDLWACPALTSLPCLTPLPAQISPLASLWHPRLRWVHSMLRLPQPQPSPRSVTKCFFVPLPMDRELLESRLYCTLLILSA